jgi:4-amino-4-deoxy-L-arabinose transferase-like glycosyltransferase
MLLILVVTIGALLRLWGLGNVGLFGDEDVMGLATRGILETGSPILPSGLYYARALPQLYMMAMSTHFFGDTEWALRLPSVLVGTLGILAGYWLARRFLPVNWSIMFAVVIALLPSMISLSQTARMYGFYVTLVMLFAVAIFRWERTESFVAYFIAIVACLVSLSFHALTVFSTLLFFYPGLVKLSWRLLGFGAVAFTICVIFQQEHSSWVGSHYFPLVEVVPDQNGSRAALLARKVSPTAAVLGALIVGVATGLGFVIARKRRMARDQATWLTLSVLCLVSAVILGLLLQYHMAGLAFIFGTIFFVRAGFHLVFPAILGALLLVMLAIQAYLTWQLPNVQGLNDLIETLAGMPNPKPYLPFTGFSPLGVVAYGIVAMYFAAQFARGLTLPDHVLFFFVSVFAPLFLMGFLAGEHVAPRYVIGFFPFFVLATFAGLFDIVNRHGSRLPANASLKFSIASILLLAIFVSPTDLRLNVNPQYSDFQALTDHRGVDHKGAAEYVLSQGLDSDDLVMALDAQQQGYYLGDRLDYYLRSLNDGRNSSFMRDGEMLSLYTGTPQIPTGEELAKVFGNPRHGEILILGSGELESNRMRYMDNGILETMQDFGVEEVYQGRDGVTKVWRYLAGKTETGQSVK